MGAGNENRKNDTFSSFPFIFHSELITSIGCTCITR